MKDFKDLRVWSKAHELTVFIYNLTRAFPKDEIYGLTSQVRARRRRLALTLRKDAEDVQTEK